MDPAKTSAPWRSRITGSGTIKVAEARPHALNFRLHPHGRSQALAASLDQVGWVQQIVVNTTTGNLIDGHLRVELARQRGEAELPCLFVELEPDEERLVLASLDPIGAMATADQAKLSELLVSIDSQDEQVRTLIEQIVRQEHLVLPAAAGLADPDEVPEPPAEPVSRPGDLWLLGDHRLLCGDSTKAEDVQRLMAGERAGLMATDPPYLVDYQGGAHPTSEANKGAATKDKHWDSYIDHEHSVAFYVEFLRAALDCALTEDAAVYQAFGIMRTEVIWQSWREAGLLPHQVLVWVKSRSVLTYSHYMWNYEPLMYGWREGHMPAAKPPADAKAVWEIGSAIEDGAGSVHPTMKPVELIRRPIGYHTAPGDLLYEPFSGSGTCQQLGRRCYALELSPAFVDVAVRRWQRFTGKQATLEGDGRSFAELAAERLPGSTPPGSAR